MDRFKHFDVRHHPSDPFERIALELAGKVRIYRTSGKVRARTKWGARRLIRKLFGVHLIEILSVD